jgi:hypothetical protein
MSYEEVTTTPAETTEWRPGQKVQVHEYECGTSTGPQHLNPDPEPEESFWDTSVLAWAKVAK